MSRPKNERRPVDPAHRRRVGRAAALWGYLALGSISILSALTLWHLARRGRLIRDRLGPPRKVDLSEGNPS